MSTPVSVRFPDEIAQRLRRHSARAAEATSGLIVRLVDEGMRMAEHPGIVFRGGPSGRRAGLVAGPDVWEVIGVLKDFAAHRADTAHRRTAQSLGISASQVRVAESYYAAFNAEIDARLLLNADAARRGQQGKVVSGPLPR